MTETAFRVVMTGFYDCSADDTPTPAEEVEHALTLYGFEGVTVTHMGDALIETVDQVRARSSVMTHHHKGPTRESHIGFVLMCLIAIGVAGYLLFRGDVWPAIMIGSVAGWAGFDIARPSLRAAIAKAKGASDD
jgi:hypothetical protein